MSLLPRGLNYVQRRFKTHICKAKLSGEELMKLSDQTIANNYSPLPVVLQKGRGVNLYDINGKSYMDFFSGYSAMSLGHCHPRLIKALCEQSKELTHISRVVYTRPLAEYGEYITQLFSYEKVLPMNTGNEAAETAVKLARKWGYKIKGIPSNEAKVLFAENNFWGTSIAAISSSNEPKAFLNYGPYVPLFETVPFNDVEELEEKFKDCNVCAFVIEPVQGEAGVIIPDPGYLQQVRELCTQYKVLMIADEVQCGLGRCGNLLCCDIYNVRPDIVILGKSLSGGLFPVSAVLADCHIMEVIEPGTHSSTYGGNPLACRIAMESLKILQEEKLVENAKKMGECLRLCLCNLPKDVVCEMRGIGLLNAIELRRGVNARNVCLDMMSQGLLVRTARKNVIHLCPPLNVRESQIRKACQIIRTCLENSRGSSRFDPTPQTEYKPKKRLFSFSQDESRVKNKSKGTIVCGNCQELKNYPCKLNNK